MKTPGVFDCPPAHPWPGPVPAAVAAPHGCRLALLVTATAAGPFLQAAIAQEVTLPPPDPHDRVQISGGTAVRWQEGVYEVICLNGPCTIRQGGHTSSGQGAVLWIERVSPPAAEPHRVLAYVERLVQEHRSPGARDDAGSPLARVTADSWVGHYSSFTGVDVQAEISEGNLTSIPAHYRRARQACFPYSSHDVRPAQFAVPQPDVGPPPLAQVAPSAAAPTRAPRRIRLSPRSTVRIQAQSFPSSDGKERITVIDSGVVIIIDGVPNLGTIDIATDRLVIFSPVEVGEFSSSSQVQQDGELPLEFYLEGNIEFRQGERIIYANSMYYNVREEYGVILDAELLAQVPQFEGIIRLKSEVLRQVDRNRFQALNAALTTSRLGVPRYWFQTGELTYEDYQAPRSDPATGAVALDPATGQPLVGPQRRATSRNNTIFLGGVPVFYWPRFATDFTRPTTFISDVRIGSDRILGTQIGVGLDLNQIFGIQGPWNEQTDWIGNIDYLSKRGWGYGTKLEYEFDRLWRLEGPAIGYLDAWGIKDQGLDNLGRDRLALAPEKDYRGRVFLRHRQRLLTGWEITAEIGLISDRNFLEQYYELEWDRWPDELTGLQLKRLVGNGSWNLTTQFRVNDFFTQTQWLPRFDQFQLGQSLVQDRVTWLGHTQIAYGELQTASTPLDPVQADKTNPLAWEADREGIRAGGRHELDFPVQLGAVKVVPYVLGEAMHWGQDLAGESLTRLYGQAGVRASLPMWSVDPTVQSQLFNVNGIAHKIVFEGDFVWADADANLDQLPLYDELDDDAIEFFRRRLVDDIFGGTPGVDDFAPRRFDERFFAFRSGLQSWVTSPSTEIADDLSVFRVMARQRWQTKRGAPGRQRVVDWITFDAGASFFPDPDRDNFGEVVGLINYESQWHVGDRLTLLSDGFADVFGQGLRTFTFGGSISRPQRGSLFLGFRSIEGPISSNLLNAAVNYRFSEKWIGTAGTIVDFGRTGTTGTLVELTRIGESFLVTVAANRDQGRDNAGFGISITPRFLASSRVGLIGGVPLPPLGALGIQ